MTRRSSMLTAICVAVGLFSVGTPAAHAASAATVDVRDDAFAPASTTVDAGGTVTWTFSGSNFHSVTADSGAFDSHPTCTATATGACATAGAAAFSTTFASAGTFAYYCRVHGAPGGVGMAGTVVVAAAPDTSAPGAVTTLRATPADHQVTLRWTNPSDADFAGVVVRQAEGSVAPVTPTDGTAVYAGSGTSVTSTGLTNGTTYSFAVFSRDAVPNYGPAVTVSAAPREPTPTTLRIARKPANALYGTAVTVGGRLVVTSTSTGVPGQYVEVLTRRRGTTDWTAIARQLTSATGDVTFRHVPHHNSEYALRHLYTPFYDASLSPVAPVGSIPRLSSRLSSLVVEQGATPTITGAVLPVHPGQGVYLQRYSAGAWHRVALATVSATGAYRFPVRASFLGTFSYRVYVPADAHHLGAIGSTHTLSVMHRTLRSGMSGADVSALQQRLIALRYDPARVTGHFNYDTTHAVLAFQKANGLPRTGVVTAGVMDRLARPLAPRLRNPVAGTSVEVDLTKQVLYYARDGVILRILDVSSGNNQLYTVDGVTDRAVTPEGAFRIERKIDGVRVSRLGELYRPAYFIRGYAIHGSASVPTYPASHGCIRITNPAMDRLFALLNVGARVWVYRS